MTPQAPRDTVIRRSGATKDLAQPQLSFRHSQVVAKVDETSFAASTSTHLDWWELNLSKVPLDSLCWKNNTRDIPRVFCILLTTGFHYAFVVSSPYSFRWTTLKARTGCSAWYEERTNGPLSTHLKPISPPKRSNPSNSSGV